MALSYVPSSAGSTGNPPVKIGGVMGSLSTARTGSLSPSSLWLYNSTNTHAEILASSIAISDMQSLGIQTGDPVIVVQATAGSTAPVVTLGVFARSSAASTAGSVSAGYSS